MVNAIHSDGGFIGQKRSLGDHLRFQSPGTGFARNRDKTSLSHQVEKTSLILSCPSCSAQYFADDKAIGENGRTVRCAACAHAWFAKPELSLEQALSASDLSREKVERVRHADAAEPVSPHLAYREKEFARRQSGSRIAAISAWSVSAVLFFGLGAGAVVKRDSVVRFWPQASSAYAMAGLDTNRYGLEFGPVLAERTFDGTTPVLSISGDVLNVTNRFQSVPMVKVDLRDDNGRNVESILISLDHDVLGPGEKGGFVTRMDSPPLEAFDLAMSFVEPDSVDMRLVQPALPAPDASHDETHDDASSHGETHASDVNAHGAEPTSHGETHDDTQAVASETHQELPAEPHDEHAPAEADPHGSSHG